jgi:hypothetical protein
MNEAIQHEYQELLIEIQTLGLCLGERASVECCQRIWERLTKLDQLLQEAHPFPWGGSLNRDFQDFDDATIAHLEDAIFNIWGIQ